ncbi:uncharacterized protein [Garra rufa]|uniref:uncharacterized protein n=1 Tax=Garra rufa TaxID=137080 RepID=UPI003CCE7E20
MNAVEVAKRCDSIYCDCVCKGVAKADRLRWEIHFFFAFLRTHIRMDSVSLPCRKNLSAQQALAWLQEMDEADSDGGEISFVQQASDSSSEESEKETEQNHNTPPRKMRRSTGKPCKTQTAKDGTVWAEEDIGIPSAVANHSCFTAQAGPTESAKRKITSVLQSFLCLLDVGMLQTIRECTVHQARRTEPDWNLAIHELMAFISILFVRAIMCPVGAIVDCWSESFLVPVIKETMPRDRFISIMQHLRFDDKDTRAERVKTDKFAAISDIWTRFNKNCAESFTPGEHMTIDVQLFPTKVRCPFTQYIATKPDKSGIKFWMATDLETKYVCKASPYLGKDPSRQKGERLAENVVMNLMEPFLDKGRNVTTDNFFTSLSLAHRLLQRQTTLLGTMNKVRRELPQLAKDTAQREVFSTSVLRSGSVSLTIYAPKKKKTVCVLSSMHQNVTIGDGRKRKPNTITDYNHMKCVVDVLDQMARMYSVCTGRFEKNLAHPEQSYNIVNSWKHRIQTMLSMREKMKEEVMTCLRSLDASHIINTPKLVLARMESCLPPNKQDIKDIVAPDGCWMCCDTSKRV